MRCGMRIQGFGSETRGERYHLEYFGVDGRIMLKRIFGKWNGDGGVHWIDLKDRIKWQAVVNKVMNSRIW